MGFMAKVIRGKADKWMGHRSVNMVPGAACIPTGRLRLYAKKKIKWSGKPD